MAAGAGRRWSRWWCWLSPQTPADRRPDRAPDARADPGAAARRGRRRAAADPAYSPTRRTARPRRTADRYRRTRPPAYPTSAGAGVPGVPAGAAAHPRKRGPILFWFTLALIALAEGVLGIVDLAGVPVADSAYPALAVGITGVMLLVGAFFGRAGGLILLGLVATVALAGATVADHWDGDTVHGTPAVRAADVDDSYRISAGELVLDLTHGARPRGPRRPHHPR